MKQVDLLGTYRLVYSLMQIFQAKSLEDQRGSVQTVALSRQQQGGNLSSFSKTNLCRELVK